MEHSIETLVSRRKRREAYADGYDCRIVPLKRGGAVLMDCLNGLGPMGYYKDPSDAILEAEMWGFVVDSGPNRSGARNRAMTARDGMRRES